MKISLWQQFSSNHSAGFAVMGRFKTVEEAEHAATLVREILVRVAKYREHLWEKYINDDVGDLELSELTPHDEENFEYHMHDYLEEFGWKIRDEYGLKTWPLFIEYAQDSQQVVNTVRVLDTTVMVAEEFIGFYTNTGETPFDELMTKLGAEVAVDSEVKGTILKFSFTCVAPDEGTANRIINSIVQSKSNYPYSDSFIVDGVFDSRIYGSMRHDGLRISFLDLRVGAFSSFHHLMDYVQSNGCEIVEHSFRSVE